jgi:hypothetical protein
LSTLPSDPRAEFRNGYKTPFTPQDHFAANISHRAELSLKHQTKMLTVNLTFRNSEIWGAHTGIGATGLFEANAEIRLSEKWSLIAGRQKINIDNDRLLCDKNWSQEGISHDVISVIYDEKKIDAKLIAGMSQNSALLSNTTYQWPNTEWYKYIVIGNFVWNMNKSFSIGGLYIAEGF